MSASQDALHESIEQLARRLRLPHLRRAAPEVLKTARSQRWDPAEALRALLEHEADGRDTSGREIRRATMGKPVGHQRGQLMTAHAENPMAVDPG